ncbi:MAG TPA: BTAD domain-containing putative transcriptional regulator [Actinospica sp.]|nr:BTAD domain-containing putative transcriptional regulator [Actinospica sp.]
MTTSPAPLRFSVLGPVSVHAAGRALPLGPLKQRAVLAVLLCQANTPVSIDLLTEAVWDDEPPRTARKNLQAYVSNLRRALAVAGAADRLTLRPGGYRITADAAELDSLRFQALAATGREAAADGDAERAARLLGEARGLWTGSPLAELDRTPVLRSLAERMTARHLSVCEDWAEAALAAGRPREVADLLAELVEQHPLRERLRAAQMAALHRSGRRGEAMAVYDELRRHLSRELGLSPNPVIESMYREILADAGDPALPAAPRPAPISLPADLPDFSGRGDTLVDLLESVTSAHAAPCVLTGPAGVGKTALALRAAHRLADEFPGGRIFVRLRDEGGAPRPASAVAAELLAHAGIRDEAPSDPDRAADRWRGWLADRRVLLVLDDAPDEAAVRPLLPGTGRGRAIVTARTQLAGLAPAHRVQVPALCAAEALDLLGRLVGTGRVLSDRPAAERVVTACGLLPIAVRAAGLKLAVLRHVPLAEFAERLADPGTVLDELAVGDVRIRPHAAEEWERLPERHRGTLRGLAGLPLRGWFTADEAAAALGAEARVAQRELELMIEAGAVVSSESEVTAHAAVYTLPYLTHLYAREAGD